MVSTTTSIDTIGVNLVILIGEVTSPPVQRTLQTGDVVSSFDIATHVDEGRISVPIAISGECDTTHVGDSVCVVGIVRRRFFRTQQQLHKLHWKTLQQTMCLSQWPLEWVFLILLRTSLRPF